MSASAFGFFLTIPFWKTSSAEHHAKVDRFFKNMHTPIDFEKEVGPANDLSQLNIMGAFAIIIGVFGAVAAVHNEFPNQAVVVRRNDVAVIKRAIHAHAKATRCVIL